MVCVNNLFEWVKGAELVELKECNVEEDPVRPELNNNFTTGYGRKIYGVKYKGEIYAIMCFAYTNKIPRSVDELEKHLDKANFILYRVKDVIKEIAGKEKMEIKKFIRFKVGEGI